MDIKSGEPLYRYNKWSIEDSLRRYYTLDCNPKDDIPSLGNSNSTDPYFLQGVLTKVDLDRAIDYLAPYKGWLKFSTHATHLSTEWEYFIRHLTAEQRAIFDFIDGVYNPFSLGAILKMLDFLNGGE